MAQRSLPKITVVTVSLNQGAFLEEALASVIGQGYRNLEYVVIDGGSTDGSVDIIRRNASELAYWVSEKDEGQSDAFRKAMARATGHIVTWVNADDVLLPGALGRVSEAWLGGARWITGHLVWIDETGGIIKMSRLPRYSSYFATRGLLSAGGPATFFARDLYERSNGFDKNLDYAMDTDLWYQFASCGARYTRVNAYLCAFRFHHGSKCSAQTFTLDSGERVRIADRKMSENAIIRSRYLKRSPPKGVKWFYRGWQLVNGNYGRALVDQGRWLGRSWREVFGRGGAAGDGSTRG